MHINKGGTIKNIMEDANQLLEKIERIRNEMMQLALQKGFQDKEVIGLSQELDKLLNKYNRLKRS